MARNNAFTKYLIKIPWGVVGVVIGILGVSISLYQNLHEPKPSIVYQKISDVNVFDVHKELDDLTVTFQGDDIKRTNKNLRIVTFKIVNNGDVDILQGHYDKSIPWGLSIGDGKVIEARTTNASSDYIKGKMFLEINNDKFVKFNNIIFERGNYFTIEALILHDKNIPPSYSPTGKMAGISEFQFVEIIQEQKMPFLKGVLYGDLNTHVARVVLYIITFIALIFVIVWPISVVDDLVTKRKIKHRKEFLENSLGVDTKNKEDIMYHVYKGYLINGAEYVSQIQERIEDEQQLIKDVKRHDMFIEYSKNIKHLGGGTSKVKSTKNGVLLRDEFDVDLDDINSIHSHRGYYKFTGMFDDDIVKTKLVKVENENLIIDKTLKEFIKSVEEG